MTTNYHDTFIQVADDSPAKQAELPPRKEQATLAQLQFEKIYDHPYRYTSDDVIFYAYAVKNNIPESEQAEARELFFSKGQPCLRSSPLTKRYGWGVHSDAQGRVALYGLGSDEYKRFAEDSKLKQVKAMRSKRA